MSGRYVSVVLLTILLILPVAAPGAAAPSDPAAQMLTRLYRANGLIAKVQVAFDARDWPLLSRYVTEYVALMRSITTQVRALTAEGAGAAASALDAVRDATLKHMNTLKKAYDKAPGREAKDALKPAMEASESGFKASTDALAKISGR